MTKVDFRLLTRDLKNEVIIIHLTNKLESASNVQAIFDVVSRNLKAYLKTVLTLTGKLVSFFSNCKCGRSLMCLSIYLQINNRITMQNTLL